MIPIRRISSLLFGSLFFAVVMVMVMPAASFAQIGFSITIGPPALPVYEQPPCPAEGYIWTPGFWAYGPDGYYWVPGTWVVAPEPGFLWTPAWWGWGGDRFIFHEGYWGLHVGFYGGISYGYGYFGHGYEGGRWDNGRFFYNRTVNNVNITNIHNTYNTTVINNTTVNRVSYNGGEGGINERPRPEEEAAERERHIAPVAAQTQHVEAARANPELRASANHGKPPIAATARPGEFKGRDVVPAREAGAPYKPERGNEQAGRPENNVPRPGNGAQAGRPENNVPRPPVPTHAKDLQPHERPAPPNTGNAKLDQKYQQQQEKLYQRQEQDHQKLQQKQEQEHQQLAKRNADQARMQQTEQKHQQQTQQLEQKHEQQQQKLQGKQRPR
jgi:WXXGXW repeat (2 copies)